MEVKSVSNQLNFSGNYLYDANLSYTQLKNFRRALKGVDIYKKDYDLKIFNDFSQDELCRGDGHFVCVTAENKKKNRSVQVLMEPFEQKRDNEIKEKVLEVIKAYEEKYKNGFWSKVKNIFR